MSPSIGWLSLALRETMPDMKSVSPVGSRSCTGLAVDHPAGVTIDALAAGRHRDHRRSRPGRWARRGRLTIVVRVGGILRPDGAPHFGHRRHVARRSSDRRARRRRSAGSSRPWSASAPMLSSTVLVWALMSPSLRQRAGDVDQAVGLGGGAERQLPGSWKHLSLTLHGHPQTRNGHKQQQ